MGDYIQNNQGNIQRQNILELVQNIPSSNVTNYIFKNEGSLSFTNKTSEWGLDQPLNSNGAAYADLDNDGDLDLIQIAKLQQQIGRGLSRSNSVLLTE